MQKMTIRQPVVKRVTRSSIVAHADVASERTIDREPEVLLRCTIRVSRDTEDDPHTTLRDCLLRYLDPA